MTTAGDMNRRIVIERATEAPNDYGESVRTWGTYATLWAERVDFSMGEKIAAGELGAFLGAHFTVRRSSVSDTITSRDRLRHDDAVWNIIGKREKRGEGRAFWEIDAVREA